MWFSGLVHSASTATELQLGRNVGGEYGGDGFQNRCCSQIVVSGSLP